MLLCPALTRNLSSFQLGTEDLLYGITRSPTNTLNSELLLTISRVKPHLNEQVILAHVNGITSLKPFFLGKKTTRKHLLGNTGVNPQISFVWFTCTLNNKNLPHTVYFSKFQMTKTLL